MIAGVLRPALRHRPDAPAIIARSGTLTYAELERAASDAAGAMWQLSVRPGDRVAACLPNDLAAPSLILAGPRSHAQGGTVMETADWARLTAGAPAPPAVKTSQDEPAGIA
jgi:acyl-CoA synthetase (AMP-forming)/AMP-acid ligase II